MDTNEDAYIATRGMAIKLRDVAGTRTIPGTDNRCQELLTVNLPVVEFATHREAVSYIIRFITETLTLDAKGG